MEVISLKKIAGAIAVGILMVLAIVTLLTLSGCKTSCGVSAEAVPVAPTVITETRAVYPPPTPAPPIYAYQPQLSK